MVNAVLSPETKNLLKELTSNHLPSKTYLGGGTAIALQLGHRRSQDLDFFTPTQFNELQWEQKLAQEWKFRLVQKDWQTLVGFIYGVKFSLFFYHYPLIAKMEHFSYVNVASLPDLAAMKLDAIIARGTKRDFIDIYFLAKKFGMDKLFQFYQQKYGRFEEKEIMIKKALLYFNDANADEMPDMRVPISWEEVKQFFVDLKIKWQEVAP